MRQQTLHVTIIAFATGCTPLVNHTPRVEPGPQSTFTFSAAAVRPAGPLGARGPVVLVPAVAFRQAAGWRPDSSPEGFGIEWALEGSLVQGASADLYAQAPHSLTGATDAGVGVAGQVGFLSGPMAYAQAGHRAGSRVYVYTTQNVAWLRRSSDGLRRAWWQPTLAVEPVRDAMPAYILFVMANIGPSADSCRTASGCGATFIQVQGARAAFGISMFFHSSLSTR